MPIQSGRSPISSVTKSGTRLIRTPKNAQPFARLTITAPRYAGLPQASVSVVDSGSSCATGRRLVRLVADVGRVGLGVLRRVRTRGGCPPPSAGT